MARIRCVAKLASCGMLATLSEINFDSLPNVAHRCFAIIISMKYAFVEGS